MANSFFRLEMIKDKNGQIKVNRESENFPVQDVVLLLDIEHNMWLNSLVGQQLASQDTDKR